MLDYAVKMREFPQEALASRGLAAGSFGAADIDALAALIADFHAAAPVAPSGGQLGAPEAVLSSALQNFEQILPLVKTQSDDRSLRALQHWTESEYAARHRAFISSKSGGCVRECHGDTAESTAATYRKLGALAQVFLDAGFPAVVDATFLKRAEREAFRAIAEQYRVPYLILDFRVPLEVLRTRVEERLACANDASETGPAVIEHQMAAREPLTPAEIAVAVAVDSTRPASPAMWQPIAKRLNLSY